MLEKSCLFLLGANGSNLPIYRLDLRKTTQESERNFENSSGFLLEIDKIRRIIFQIRGKNGEFCGFSERNHRFSIDFANLGSAPNGFFPKTAILGEEK